ncbi:MAG: SAM-dependent methyltransferase, partial [Betaproteobacteria bacterium]
MRDRAFVAEGVFATLRRLRSLTRHAGTSTPRGLAIAAVLRELGVSLRELEPVLSEDELVWAKDFK